MHGPLLVIVHYRMPAPSSLRVKRREELHLTPHIKRPDKDNLEKFLMDALKDVVWDDDARIAWTLNSKTITKHKTGETILYVQELDFSKPDYEDFMKIIEQHIKIEENVA